jgi:proline iminopeptidase
MLAWVNGTQLYVDVDGPQLRVERGKLAERPTLVVLHGGPGFDQGYLRPGLGALRDRAQVVFLDLRGQGRSGRPPIDSCTLEQMADDVAAVCTGLGLEDPVVFGHSAGGFVALHLALRHQGVARALVLCDTSPTLAPLPDDDPPPGLAERATPQAITIAERMFGGDFSTETFAEFAQLVAPYYASPLHMDVPGPLLALSRFSPDVAAHFFTALAARYDVRGQLHSIQTPTLVIEGEADWVCPPAGARALAAGISGAELVLIPHAGHFPFSEEPQAFKEIIAEFLEALPSTPPRGRPLPRSTTTAASPAANVHQVDVG